MDNYNTRTLTERLLSVIVNTRGPKSQHALNIALAILQDRQWHNRQVVANLAAEAAGIAPKTAINILREAANAGLIQAIPTSTNRYAERLISLPGIPFKPAPSLLEL